MADDWVLVPDDQRMRFPGVIGDASIFSTRQTSEGTECFLDGKRVPAVLSQKLVVGEGVPKVVLEIAVKEYWEGRHIEQEREENEPL